MNGMDGRHTISEILIPLMVIVVSSTLVWAGTSGDLTPRVPSETLADAIALQNPFTPSEEIVAKGKNSMRARYCVPLATAWKGRGE